MRRKILTAAVVAVAAGLALVPGVALAGNPKGAVIDAKILASLVNNSRASALFGDTADAVEGIYGSPDAILKQRVKFASHVREADKVISANLAKVKAWKPQSTLGVHMRAYSVWIVGAEAHAVAGVAKALVGFEQRSSKEQLKVLNPALDQFVTEVRAIVKGNGNALNQARTGIPTDEVAAADKAA